MAERLFTLEEANALVPRLEIIMSRLHQLTAHVREEVAAISLQTGQPPEEFTAEMLNQHRPELAGALEELGKLLDAIAACGGQFKGVDLGLVDFPAVVHGEVVLLCWQYGEKEIGYYHSPEAGFAGRQLLDPDAEPRGPLQ